MTADCSRPFGYLAIQIFACAALLSLNAKLGGWTDFAKQIEKAGHSVVQERQSLVPSVTVSGEYHSEAAEKAFLGVVSVPIPLWYQRQGHVSAALGAMERAKAEQARAQNELVTVFTEQMQEARTATQQIDVFEKGLLKQAEEAHGPTEILVANSGVTRDTLVLRMSEDDFDLVLETNLKGAFRCAKRASRSMLRRRWGRIIFTGSVVGLYGSPGQVNYSASKAALVGVARSLTREIGARGITANVVAPGFIETDMTASLPDAQQQALLAQIPLGHLGKPTDIAHAVAYLASPQAGYVTGQELHVNGGMYM